MPTILNEIFLKPLTHVFHSLPPDRGGLTLSDLDFLTLNVRRVLETVQSGRDFLQLLPTLDLSPVSVRCYFNSLDSERREQRVRQVQEALYAWFQPRWLAADDRLAAFPELDGREVWLGDGHKIEHATHDGCRTNSQGERVHDASQGIFALNLRTGWARVLAQCRRKEHEWKTLTRQMGRQWGSKGTIWIYDPAALDLRSWYVLKQSLGVYFISRWKANLRPVHALACSWDPTDPRNDGVLSVQRVGFNHGGEFRRIEYRDPETGALHVFLTSEMTLAPGLIAQLYRLRWDIEKSFDVLESKLGQTKAWASSDTAKRMQNEFIVMTYNLMRGLGRQLEQEEGVRDVKVEKKYEQWLEQREVQARHQGRRVSRWIQALRRATQMSLQYIRWLRNHLRIRTPYGEAVDLLRPLMLEYLR